MTTVNVTIAGFGFMGTMLAQIYMQLPGARLIGVADPRTDVTRAKLQSLGLDVPVFNSLPELLSALPETRMVVVCTSLDALEADALTALKSGRHLFCEKPLAPGLAAADRIIAAAIRAGVMAQVGHCIRFLSGIHGTARVCSRQSRRQAPQPVPDSSVLAPRVHSRHLG